MIWLMFYLRMLGTIARVRERLEERHNERERIARELHDTLLQSIQGLILRFHAVAEEMPRDSAAHIAMDRALDRADDVLVEGRDRVRDLRSAIASGDDLAQAFSNIGAELSADRAAPLRVVVEGVPAPLDADVGDEIFRIGREALVNALQHARAQTIEIEIAFEPDALRVRVRDDGVGIGADILDAGSRPGHWGLPGMRERAAKIGAQLKVWGGAGSGTEVELRVPASVAYPADAPVSWWRILRRIAGAGR
jgi:signal transduction histidine kinase